MEDVISRAAQALSSITSYTSLVLGPKGSETTIRNLQLVPVSQNSALLVIVTDNGIVRDAIIHVDSDLDGDALYAISRTLTERVAGHRLSDTQDVLRAMRREFAEKRKVLDGVSDLVADVENQQASAKIAFGGTSNILSFPEYNDVEKARTFLSLLESKDTLIRLLEQHQNVAFTVRIGPETGVPELRDCSLVTATYSIGDHTHGTIGVIGPTRMQYGRVLGVLSAMGEQLSRLLTQDTE
jgi:heat-inducible transcriptional repressor